MAVDGMEPISAADLSDVVSKLVGMSGRETVYIGNGGEFLAPTSEFSELEVNVAIGDFGTTFNTFTVPNETQTITIGRNLLDIDVSESRSMVSARNNNFTFVSRIVGIRSGGGQLIADLLAALEGVA